MLALRSALVIVLFGLVVRPPLAHPPEPEAFHLRPAATPPSIVELEQLQRLGRPVYAALPTPEPALVAMPPSSARENRTAAVAWQLRAGSETTGVVRIADATGPLDSIVVAADPDVTASGAFRVLPARSGWHEWTLSWEGSSASADSATTRIGAWVLPEAPLRALVVSVPASQEGRDVTRALESTGAQVTLAQSLGRGLTLGDAPAGVPTGAEALAEYDVVIVLTGVALTTAQLSSLTGFATRGGGVLVAGSAATSVPIARRTEAASVAEAASVDVSASTIEWLTPAELPALPNVEVETTATPLAPAGPATVVAARAEGSDLLLLSRVGRGRMAALALEDTWVWGLQGGRGEELAAFWRGLTDWLAGGARAPFAASVDPASGAPGSIVSLEVARLDTAAIRPAAVTLTRPDGSVELLTLAWLGSVGYARFVPDAAGLFAVGASAVGAGTEPPQTASGFDNDAVDRLVTPVALAADPAAAPPADAWARLALLANGSGGEAVPAEALAETLDRGFPANLIWPPPPLVWLAIALALALAEWTMRRLRGLA